MNCFFFPPAFFLALHSMCHGLNSLHSDARSRHQKQPAATGELFCRAINAAGAEHLTLFPPSPLQPLLGAPRGTHRMPVGVRKGPTDGQPKALTGAVVCHPSAPMPGFGQAPFWLGFSMFTLVTVQYLQRESYTSDFKEAGLGHSLLLGLHFPPWHPGLICF